MHASIIERTNTVSLSVIDATTSHLINFEVDCWKEGMLDKLIASHDRRRYAAINAGPQLRLFVDACHSDRYLWVRSEDGYTGSISFTDVVKAALLEIDRILAAKYQPKQVTPTC